MASLVAGVDLGGTKIQTVVMKDHRVAGSCRVETPQTGADAVLAAIAESVKASLREAGVSLSDLTATGVADHRRAKHRNA